MCNVLDVTGLRNHGHALTPPHEPFSYNLSDSYYVSHYLSFYALFSRQRSNTTIASSLSLSLTPQLNSSHLTDLRLYHDLIDSIDS
ncbi:hypothetical protein QVD17_20417 [Tagetes erecta]|uniref:Uncharacterized protein n=1 Tax=Tagetes erecta TaxID=13708 RepID=A0AAD8NX89_TARER|nr:hypothetical protein QVD17_20417 [Tagetes erecta]